NVLLVVDQFEELFAVRETALEEGDEAADMQARRRQFERRAQAADFVSLLLGLAQATDLPVYVVATMRSDFLGDCDVFYGLPEAMNRGRYLVPRLTRKQLEEAIAGPARFSGIDISRPLLDRLLNELGDRFDRLPVLQHALSRTWAVWQEEAAQGPIDVRHYEAAGTLEGALAIHAGELLLEVSKLQAVSVLGAAERER